LYNNYHWFFNKGVEGWENVLPNLGIFLFPVEMPSAAHQVPTSDFFFRYDGKVADSLYQDKAPQFVEPDMRYKLFALVNLKVCHK
jgi:hypothetical protein